MTAVAKSTWPLYVPRFVSHALEMARGAGVSIILDTGKIPVMEEAWSLATEGIVPGGLTAISPRLVARFNSTAISVRTTN